MDAPITDYRTAQGIEEVIHVTIDRSSLRQLSKITNHEIKHDENVRLITSSPERTDKIELTSSIGSKKGAPAPFSIRGSKMAPIEKT